MDKGEKRKTIMESCPEEFEADLKDFIDDLESEIGVIIEMLNVKRIEDLDQVIDAYNRLDELCDSLW